MEEEFVGNVHTNPFNCIHICHKYMTYIAEKGKYVRKKEHVSYREWQYSVLHPLWNDYKSYSLKQESLSL